MWMCDFFRIDANDKKTHRLNEFQPAAGAGAAEPAWMAVYKSTPSLLSQGANKVRTPPFVGRV
jgi:hypothetical protein